MIHLLAFSLFCHFSSYLKQLFPFTAFQLPSFFLLVCWLNFFFLFNKVLSVAIVSIFLLSSFNIEPFTFRYPKSFRYFFYIFFEIFLLLEIFFSFWYSFYIHPFFLSKNRYLFKTRFLSLSFFYSMLPFSNLYFFLGFLSISHSFLRIVVFYSSRM